SSVKCCERYTREHARNTAISASTTETTGRPASMASTTQKLNANVLCPLGKLLCCKISTPGIKWMSGMSFKNIKDRSRSAKTVCFNVCTMIELPNVEVSNNRKERHVLKINSSSPTTPATQPSAMCVP